jgi:3-oxoacyl-[acyl-carrier-protein] synthase-3
MRYQRVRLAAVGYSLPSQRIETAQIEAQLAPLYERLRLPEGRLELMTGIRERRFFPPGTRPGSISAVTAQRALQASGVDRSRIGVLVHGSVCRDHLEPATACGVHHALDLPHDCQVYDISNACLGILTGALQIANQIELGVIEAGLVVGTECGRELVETTIARLNADETLTRQEVKPFVASLTIGSGSAALLLCADSLAATGSRLLGAVGRANTSHHALCQSEGLTQFMRTDSELLMREGVATAGRTFECLLSELGWTRQSLASTICHQVGTAHRRLLFETLALDEGLDYSTFETLGNTGSAALPTALALAAEAGHLRRGGAVGLLGIGSGINCQMLGLEWAATPVGGGVSPEEHACPA